MLIYKTFQIDKLFLYGNQSYFNKLYYYLYLSFSLLFFLLIQNQILHVVIKKNISTALTFIYIEAYIFATKSLWKLSICSSTLVCGRLFLFCILLSIPSDWPYNSEIMNWYNHILLFLLSYTVLMIKKRTNTLLLVPPPEKSLESNFP